MGEPIACVAHSIRLSGVTAGDRVAIIGAGYMGRLHFTLARNLGAAPIGLIDVSPTRLEEAAVAGAAWTAVPDTAIDVGSMQDVVFVTVGTPGALELALQMADDGGVVVCYGAFPKDLLARVHPDALHHHEVSIIGVYSHEPHDWRTAAGLIRSGAVAADLDSLITATYSLDAVFDAFKLANEKPVYRVLVGALM
jgi:threonine dehydrogenase-like Zn-dependent dehydrogenase